MAAAAAKHWADPRWNGIPHRDADRVTTMTEMRRRQLEPLATDQEQVALLHDVLDSIEQQNIVPAYTGPASVPPRPTVALTGGKRRRTHGRKSHRKNRKSHRRNRKSHRK